VRLKNAVLPIDCACNPDGEPLTAWRGFQAVPFVVGLVSRDFDDRRLQAGTFAANRIAADTFLSPTQTRSVQFPEFRNWRQIRQVAEPNMKPILESLHRSAFDIMQRLGSIAFISGRRVDDCNCEIDNRPPVGPCFHVLALLEIEARRPELLGFRDDDRCLLKRPGRLLANGADCPIKLVPKPSLFLGIASC
jgi:hypothetical protein